LGPGVFFLRRWAPIFGKRTFRIRKELFMTEDIKPQILAVQDKLNKSIEAESAARPGSLEKSEAIAAKTAAEDELHALRQREAHGDEDEVVLVASSGVSYEDHVLGVTFENGRARVPRSAGERLAPEFESYDVEEIKRGAKKK
jgi:hypothetical protein